MRIFLATITYLSILLVSSCGLIKEKPGCESNASTGAVENMISSEIDKALDNPITLSSREEILKSINVSVKSTETTGTDQASSTYTCKAKVEVTLPSKARDKVKTNKILAILIGESGVGASSRGIESEISYSVHASPEQPVEVKIPFGHRAIANSVVAIGAAGGFN